MLFPKRKWCTQLIIFPSVFCSGFTLVGLHMSCEPLLLRPWRFLHDLYFSIMHQKVIRNISNHSRPRLNSSGSEFPTPFFLLWTMYKHLPHHCDSPVAHISDSNSHHGCCTNSVAGEPLWADRLRADRLRSDRLRSDRFRSDGRTVGRADRFRSDRLPSDRLRSDRLWADRIRADRIRMAHCLRTTV